MKITGIVSEYNPFHNGHKFHIEKTRENGATHIVAVMSGNIIQRGDISVASKHIRAKSAIQNGVDLVIELPTPYSVSSAQNFARGAIHLLNGLGCVDELSFGSECGDIELLKSVAEAVRLVDSKDIKNSLSSGLSYPTAVLSAVSKSINPRQADVLKSPNNVLGLEYINAISEFKSKINPFTVERNSVLHDSALIKNSFASASKIREMIENDEDFSSVVPQNISETFKDKDIFLFKGLEKVIFYKLLSLSKQDYAQLPDCTNGLDNRIYEGVRSSSNLDELLQSIKSKNFTMARIRRVIFYALLNVKHTDFEILPPYIRVLGCNEKGFEIIKRTKKVGTLPISHSLAKLSKINDNAKRYAELDEFATYLQELSVFDKKVHSEYSTKFEITEL